MGNNIKEHLDDYYRQSPVPVATTPIAIPLAPTTGIKDVPLPTAYEAKPVRGS
jgi:hypothetical protein